MSAARLTLAEVDRLIDKLDRAAPERGDWQAAFDRLLEAFTRARKFQRVQLQISGLVLLGWLLYSGVQLYRAHWDLWALDHNIVEQAALFLANLATVIFPLFFPVLRRHSRVATVLTSLGADLPGEGRGRVPERLPPEVALALENLERARSPEGLRPAFETVEAWQLSPRGNGLGAVSVTFFWFLALIVALSTHTPEFWRGAAFMLIVVIALWAAGRRISHVSATERVETALGRWRHLVPAMREESR